MCRHISLRACVSPTGSVASFGQQSETLRQHQSLVRGQSSAGAFLGPLSPPEPCTGARARWSPGRALPPSGRAASPVGGVSFGGAGCRLGGAAAAGVLLPAALCACVCVSACAPQAPRFQKAGPREHSLPGGRHFLAGRPWQGRSRGAVDALSPGTPEESDVNILVCNHMRGSGGRRPPAGPPRATPSTGPEDRAGERCAARPALPVAPLEGLPRLPSARRAPTHCHKRGSETCTSPARASPSE